MAHCHCERKRSNPAIKDCFVTSFLAMTIVLTGCAKKEPLPLLKPSQVEQKITKLLKEDYSIDAVLKRLEHTLWVYIPSDKHFFEIKANEKGPVNSTQASEAPAILYLDGEFKDNQLNIQYDISSVRGYERDYGFSSTYTERYRELQRYVFTAVSRAYFDLEDKKIERFDGETVPSFIVIVLADITNGLEARILLTYKDMMRALDQTFQEEYAKRVVLEYPQGNIKLVGDTTGETIDIHDLTWGEFLMRQILYRVTFKYKQSAFPPSNDTQMEILTEVTRAVQAYSFDDFESAILHDLKTDQITSIPKDKLPPLQEESQGRLIHIQFKP